MKPNLMHVAYVKESVRLLPQLTEMYNESLGCAKAHRLVVQTAWLVVWPSCQTSVQFTWHDLLFYDGESCCRFQLKIHDGLLTGGHTILHKEKLPHRSHLKTGFGHESTQSFMEMTSEKADDYPSEFQNRYLTTRSGTVEQHRLLVPQTDKPCLFKFYSSFGFQPQILAVVFSLAPIPALGLAAVVTDLSRCVSPAGHLVWAPQVVTPIELQSGTDLGALSLRTDQRVEDWVKFI